MKKLRVEIEGRLISAGFSKLPIDVIDPSGSKLDTKTKGASAPFFTLGEFDGNFITVEIQCPLDVSALDTAIDAVNISNETHFLHALRKSKSRVAGKRLTKYVLICEYKTVKQPDEEII